MPHRVEEFRRTPVLFGADVFRNTRMTASQHNSLADSRIALIGAGVMAQAIYRMEKGGLRTFLSGIVTAPPRPVLWCKTLRLVELVA